MYKIIQGKIVIIEAEKQENGSYITKNGEILSGFDTEKEAIKSEIRHLTVTTKLTILSSNVSEKEKNKTVGKALKWIRKHGGSTKELEGWLQEHYCRE